MRYLHPGDGHVHGHRGKVGSILGRRRAFAIGCVVYGAGSLTTALAPNPPILILGWSFLEGIGAALIMPAIVALLAGNFPPHGGPAPSDWYGGRRHRGRPSRSPWAWQNTGTNLGASIGTALDGSILIAGLTASFLIGIQQNPAIPADVKAQASVDVWQSSRSPCLVF